MSILFRLSWKYICTVYIYKLDFNNPICNKQFNLHFRSQQDVSRIQCRFWPSHYYLQVGCFFSSYPLFIHNFVKKWQDVYFVDYGHHIVLFGCLFQPWGSSLPSGVCLQSHQPGIHHLCCCQGQTKIELDKK